MRIITWNLERLKKLTPENAKELLLAYDADIYVLTETNDKMNLDEGYYSVSSKAVYPGHDGITDYEIGECRTQIFTKYPISK